MTTVIGLDLSLTNTGVARITWGGIVLSVDIARFQSEGHKTDPWTARADRIIGLKRQIVEHVLPGVDLLMLEGPSFNSKSPSSHDRSWLWGSVYEFLVTHGVEVIVVPPASAKKWATNNGNADKDDMVLTAARMWPEVEGIKNDTADALALAGIGMQLLEGPCPFQLYVYRCAVVDGFRSQLRTVA